jgi:hypothetical protein
VVTGGNVAKPYEKIWQHLLEYVAYVRSLKNGKILPNLQNKPKWLPNFQMWYSTTLEVANFTVTKEHILSAEKRIKNISAK